MNISKTLGTLLVVGFLFLASEASATDGDGCAAIQWSSIGGGTMKATSCVVICDDDNTNAACTEYDMRGIGLADVVEFIIWENDAATTATATGADGSCTAGTFTIGSSPTTGLATGDNNVYDLGTTTAVAVDGTKNLQVDTSESPIKRYLYVTISAVANCSTDTMDLLMVSYERAASRN